MEEEKKGKLRITRITKTRTDSEEELNLEYSKIENMSYRSIVYRRLDWIRTEWDDLRETSKNLENLTKPGRVKLYQTKIVSAEWKNYRTLEYKRRKTEIMEGKKELLRRWRVTNFERFEEKRQFN